MKFNSCEIYELDVYTGPPEDLHETILSYQTDWKWSIMVL